MTVLPVRMHHRKYFWKYQNNKNNMQCLKFLEITCFFETSQKCKSKRFVNLQGGSHSCKTVFIVKGALASMVNDKNVFNLLN